MTDSPADATPYEVLGVLPTADDDELRRAYRRAARESHPDLGGDARRFRQVQVAWERIGTPAARRAYDAGSRATSGSAGTSGPSGSSSWRSDPGRDAYAPPAARRDSRPRARSHGHPGGRSREVFLQAEREWVGLGDPIDDPYDPVLVRSAPRHVRRLLGEALAEEATASIVADMGIGVTVWHDLDAGAEGKLDHAVLTTTGLWAVESIDWGGAVRIEHGEVTGETLAPGERPVKELVRAARAVQKQTRVRFTGRLLVVPDTAVDEDVQVVGPARKPTAFVVRRSALRQVLNGVWSPEGNVDVFAVRDQLQQTVRFV
ncbi:MULTISPECIES: DnaJ domain-containing protein [Curtobacterium]|uniref:DnaJ domain-containing protein n=1 Tax=Curtobacterium citreum TaxID=2036 RepID=A0A850DW81_9MICO|nr:MULTISPECIES: DnaJ domain-containing protein [Curtobacterium]NUU28440.1 DnaJ domain-containing protein [Curtobacterium albidum]QKS16565.1 DnaJ domain-containing protein [Curtobacterium sp. Csp2]WIJ46604.1 DnaJ domain-containing protein [Curtobacterium citreum]